MKSNKYVPVGMLFLILAIILNVVSNVSDLVLCLEFSTASQ